MTNNLPKQKLETYCEFINGGAWNESEYTDSGIPVLKVSNIKNQAFLLEDIDYLSIEGAKKYVKNLLNQHDLIVATVGSHPNLINSAAGRTISVPESLQGYLLNQNAVCIRTKDNEVLFQPYLRYIGETDFFRAYIQARGKGAANQMRIAIGEIKNFPIHLPELAIQKKIATILSAYDDLIENNLKRIKLLEEMAQITYEEWFVRLKFPGHETTPMDSETSLPLGWSNTKLASHIKFHKGKKLDEIFDIPVPNSSKILLLDSLENGVYKYALSTGHVKAKRGDLIMLMDGARSSWVFFAENGIVGSTISKITSEKIPLTLLYHFFKSHLEWLQINNTGAAIPHANKQFINRINFKLASSDVIKLWCKTINPIYQSIWNLKDQNQLLKEARDILLPRLMTGMIDVDTIQLPE